MSVKVITRLELDADVPESSLKYVVIAANYKGKWLFVRHRDRDSFEMPGGHIDPGEDCDAAAKRELYEETGALSADIRRIGVYCVGRGESVSYGTLYFAGITELGDILGFEMAERIFSDKTPEKLTYPEILPMLLSEANNWMAARKTTVYLVRHCETDYGHKEDNTRPLTEKGNKSAKELVDVLSPLGINAVYSSPYRRALDTVTPFALSAGLYVTAVYGLRERRITKWIDDFESFAQRQWSDIGYEEDGNESLLSTQKRNIAALEDILESEESRTIAIATHGCAMCTIFNYYDAESFGYEHYKYILPLMPCIYRLEYIGKYLFRSAQIM